MFLVYHEGYKGLGGFVGPGVSEGLGRGGTISMIFPTVVWYEKS